MVRHTLVSAGLGPFCVALVGPGQVKQCAVLRKADLASDDTVIAERPTASEAAIFFQAILRDGSLLPKSVVGGILPR